MPAPPQVWRAWHSTLVKELRVHWQRTAAVVVTLLVAAVPLDA